MSDTLLQRLRQYEGEQSQTTACYNGLRDEAADEIDRLREALIEIIADYGDNHAVADIARAALAKEAGK